MSTRDFDILLASCESYELSSTQHLYGNLLSLGSPVLSVHSPEKVGWCMSHTCVKGAFYVCFVVIYIIIFK